MTNPTRKYVVGLLALSVALGAAGCEKKKKKAPPPPPPPPPKVEAPKPVDVQALLQELKSDQRVKFVDEQAPADRSMAEDVIKFANAFVKGDSAGVKAMLDAKAKLVLAELESSGDWATSTKEIEQVRIVSLTNTSDAEASSTLVGMAIQAPGQAYLLAWSGTKRGESWVFSNALSQGDVKPRASDFDGVVILTSALPKEDFMLPKLDGTGAGGKALPDAPAAADPTTNSGRKNTPAGPIKIPGG